MYELSYEIGHTSLSVVPLHDHWLKVWVLKGYYAAVLASNYTFVFY